MIDQRFGKMLNIVSLPAELFGKMLNCRESEKNSEKRLHFVGKYDIIYVVLFFKDYYRLRLKDFIRRGENL